MNRNRKQKILSVRHVGTGFHAIGMRGKDGTIWVQFNNMKHPHAGGWHLYPRHHFARRHYK